ncbi:hypothetical protein DPEC_G00212750 [Dallia pectoralis]|uniref:Uncharacterized protein n=1 Tax=Dallia pectoralis TaxID=75939 RepID=A0ACC2G6K6_DALPE|nr:hypothetical protein DPEC_G00212750 [Dallia pectoralis]
MDSLEIEEQLGRIKKRDLFQTHFYKTASRVFGPVKPRVRVFTAPPMPTPPVCKQMYANKVPTSANKVQKIYQHDSTAEMFMESEAGVSSPSAKELLLDNNVSEDWVNERRCLRRQLDSLGDVTRWVRSKQMVTELEIMVVEREKKTPKSPSRVPDYNMTPPRACQASVRARVTCPSRQPNVPRMRAVDVRFSLPEVGILVVPEQLETPVSSLRGVEANKLNVNELAGDIETCTEEEIFHGDHRNLPEKEKQGSPLGVDTGGPWDISRMRGRQQGTLSPAVLRPVWSCAPQPGLELRGDQLLTFPSSVVDQQERALIQQHRRNRIKQGMIRDEEVLAMMRTVCTGNQIQDAHSNPSSLGGDAGRLVDRFRRQCLGEYLGTLEKCHNEGVTVNQATLERVLLHPGDSSLRGSECLLRQAGSNPMPGCGNRLSPWTGYNSRAPEEEEEDDHDLEEEDISHKVCHETIRCPSRSSVHQGIKQKTKHWASREEIGQMTKNMRGPSGHSADPNAFWPGQDNHVRLYLPRIGLPPEGVLFEHIVHCPAPSTGTWPINNKGYFTSGDIEGHKTYIL